MAHEKAVHLAHSMLRRAFGAHPEIHAAHKRLVFDRLTLYDVPHGLAITLAEEILDAAIGSPITEADDQELARLSRGNCPVCDTRANEAHDADCSYHYPEFAP